MKVLPVINYAFSFFISTLCQCETLMYISIKGNEGKLIRHFVVREKDGNALSLWLQSRLKVREKAPGKVKRAKSKQKAAFLSREKVMFLSCD